MPRFGPGTFTGSKAASKSEGGWQVGLTGSTEEAAKREQRRAAGGAWHDNDLVFCHENGDAYTSDQLNWRFSKMTRKAGIGRWHAHEDRHTAVRS